MSQPFQTPDTPEFQALWNNQRGVCALCGKPMLRNRFDAPHAQVWAKRRATFDHIKPRSKGGIDTPDNLQLAHAHCNRIKGNRG